VSGRGAMSDPIKRGFFEKKQTYLFSWDNVPGSESERLQRILKDDYKFDLAKDAKFHKSDDDMTISISNGENAVEITIEEEKEKATLKIGDGKIIDLKVKKENGKLNIYKQTRVEWFLMWITKALFKDLRILILLGAFGLLLIIVGIAFAIVGRFGVSFATIGIGCFLFSLALMSYLTCCSIPQDDEKRRRRSLLLLDRKEIRRSLAISFTILFILLIAFYFMEAERVVNYAINPLQPLDENRTKLAVEGLASLSNVITAFATIYVVIIGFYFGSRVYEKIKEIKNAEETLKIRYIMDDIEFDEFKTKTKVLKGLKTKPLLEIKAIKRGHKITIEHKGGDAIDLKNAKIKIEVNEKKAWIDFAAHACKKDVFEEEEKMEIDMDEIIKDGDDYEIKVIDKNGKPAVTGITRGSICNCITEVDLKNAGNNKVTVVFTDPTGEIINKKQEITIEGSP
jgi:hypothetical protein